jgi:hypothetical protein
MDGTGNRFQRNPSALPLVCDLPTHHIPKAFIV